MTLDLNPLFRTRYTIPVYYEAPGMLCVVLPLVSAVSYYQTDDDTHTKKVGRALSRGSELPLHSCIVLCRTIKVVRSDYHRINKVGHRTHYNTKRRLRTAKIDLFNFQVVYP